MTGRSLERHLVVHAADAHRLPPDDWKHEFEYRAFDAKKAAKLEHILGGLSRLKAI
jgi:hypothetical protein